MNNNGALLKSHTCLFHIPPFPPPISRRCLLSIQLPKHRSFHVKLSSPSSVFSSPTGTEAFQFEEEDVIANMRQWSRNKPRGFGEGRVYDTSLEDKLLQELEQSRINKDDENSINKDENNTKHKGFNKSSEAGIRVRLGNLPKKKNIHRDLQAAFKPFLTGIIDILPAVSGNQKTREPVCKGFAFVHFKSLKEANRFVDIFSTQPITFGKVQKQIRCEIMKSNPSVDRIESPLLLPVSNATMAVNSNPLLDPCVEDAAFDMMKIGDDDLTEDYCSLNNVAHEAQESFKKQVDREKGKKKKKTPKLNIPGSANRLKMKEKALLSGVFSKYGGKSSSD